MVAGPSVSRNYEALSWARRESEFYAAERDRLAALVRLGLAALMLMMVLIPTVAYTKPSGFRTSTTRSSTSSLLK
jgi:hypothetical protein